MGNPFILGWIIRSIATLHLPAQRQALSRGGRLLVLEVAMSNIPYASDLKPGIRLSPSRRAISRAAIGLALALGAAAAADYGYDYFTSGRYLQSTDDAYVKADSTLI